MDYIDHSELVRARFDKIHHINIHINYVGFFSLHEHDCLELMVVLRGEGVYRSDNGQVAIGPGDITLRNFYEPHELEAKEGEQLSTLCIQVSASFCREYFPKLRNLRFDTSRVAELPAEDLQKIHDLAVGAAQDFFGEAPGYQLACVGKISTLLAFLIAKLPYKETHNAELMAKQTKGDRKRRLINYIDQHFKEKITLESVAATECITPAHLCHFFRDNFHMSFREYLNGVRLEKALVLMRDPRLYLVDICMETGFSDSRYLNTVFERTFGLGVSEYRKKCLEEDKHSEPVREISTVAGGRYTHQECVRMMNEHIASGGFTY